jgi:predicted phosphoribosyltransferase
VEAIRALQPVNIIAAAPVASPQAANAVRARVDDLVCLSTPRQFQAVGLWYEDFEPTTDDDVRALLERSAASSLNRFLYTQGGSHGEPIETQRKR